MTWNYRIGHRPSVENGGYSIHEVYYDDMGEIEFYTTNTIPPFGYDVAELSEDIDHMLKSIADEPIDLDYIDELFSVKNYLDE